MLRALVAVSGVAVLLLSAVLARADEGAITLSPGWNAVTWNGAAPYAIADFADTPVTKVHRWDAVRQEWLSRFVGRDGGRLPELHLLPRVQYLLVAEGKYELDVPDPIAGIDPYAALSAAVAPDDPLRFEAYWPNEDSPLEDLVVLRGEDERLSVRAEVTRGVGDVEVYWTLDGALNYQGLASDDVELLVGKHDDARLYAVDRAGQPAVVNLPRVVKLPPLELPEMVYGITAHLQRGVAQGWGIDDWYTWSMAAEAMDMIRDAGLQFVRFDLAWDSAQPDPGDLDDGVLVSYQRLFAMLDERGLVGMPIIYNGSPAWANGCVPPNPIIPGWQLECWSTPAYDTYLVQAWGRLAASRFPEIRYWQVGNEPNLDYFWSGLDPKLYVDHLKAIALGIWYENTDAIIIGAGICCNWPSHDGDEGLINGIEFLAQLYEFGYGPYHDVNALHYPKHQQSSYFLDRYLAVMSDYGDAERPIWSSEMGFPWGDDDETQQALFIAEELAWLTERPEVRGAFIYNFRDSGEHEAIAPFSGLVRREYKDRFVPKESYWAVREFITGQPPPDPD